MSCIVFFFDSGDSYKREGGRGRGMKGVWLDLSFNQS